MLTLEQVKLYLRIDHDDEDSLINSFIAISQDMVENILRKKLTEYETIPEPINQAMYFVIATLYESRQVTKSGGIQMSELIDVVKRLLFAYRDERF